MAVNLTIAEKVSAATVGKGVVIAAKDCCDRTLGYVLNDGRAFSSAAQIENDWCELFKILDGMGAVTYAIEHL